MAVKQGQYATGRPAYKAGKAARCDGEPPDSNPHASGDEKSFWYSGWYDENTERFLSDWEKRRKMREETDGNGD